MHQNAAKMTISEGQRNRLLLTGDGVLQVHLQLHIPSADTLPLSQGDEPASDSILIRPRSSSSRSAMTDNGDNDTSFQPIARALKRIRTASRRKHWGGLCENHSWGEIPMRTISCRSSADCPRIFLMSGSRGRIGQVTNVKRADTV